MARRITSVVMAVVAALTLVTAAPGGAPPAGAALGDPVVSVALPLDHATRLAVDGETGRVLVLGDDGVAVRSATGAAVGLVPVTGTDIATNGDGTAVVLDGPAGTMTKIDAQTLAITTWSLGWNRMDGLVAEAGKAWTTGFTTGTGRQLLEVDLATGALTSRSSSYDSGPVVLTGYAWRLVMVETGSLGTSTATIFNTQVTGPATVVATRELPQERVEDAHLTHDAIGLSVAAGDEVRAYHAPALTDWGSLPVDGHAPAVFGDGWMVVTGARQGPDTVSVVNPFDLDATRVIGGVDVSSPRRGMGFSADHRQLYVLGLGAGGDAPVLQIVEIGPAVTSMSPRVIDPDGGADISSDGQGLAGSEVRVASTAADLRVDGDEQLVVRTRPMCCTHPGVYPVEITTPLGLQVDPRPQVRVVDLGPYTDSHALAAGAALDFTGRATGDLGPITDQRLFEGGEPGDRFVQHSWDQQFREARPLVLRLYWATLGRGPDRNGLEFWNRALVDERRPLSWVVRAFTASPEFRGRYGSPSDGAFVDLLYANVLGRPAEPAGRAFWVDQLRRGVARDKLVVHFSESGEHWALRRADVDVTMLLLGMIDRVPTASQRERWLPGLRAAGEEEYQDVLGAVGTEVLRGTAYATAH